MNKIYAEHSGIRDGRDWTRGYLGVKNHLPTTDPLLLIKSGGDLRLYEQVAQDDQVKSCLQQRFRALISHDWRVTPASEKRADVQKADFVTAQLQALRWDEIVEKMLWGIFYGFSIAEILWEKQGEMVGIEAIKVRNRRRFHFGEDQLPRLITYKDPMGEDLPPQKFWHFCSGADHDDEPYGRGLAFWLYWYVIKFKKPTIAHKARHSELFAMPARKATYPNNATEQEKNTVWDALGAFGVDSQIMLPEGFMIELIEASRAGDGGYDTMIDICNKAIAKVILSQSLTTDSAATGLGSNQADVAQDVATSIVEADADLICASLNSSVIRWLIDYNWPGTTSYPRFEYDLSSAPDLKSLAERDQTLSNMGFAPTPEYISKTYGDGFRQPEKATEPATLSPSQVSALTSLISIGSGWPPKALEAAITIAFPSIPIEQVQALTTSLSPEAKPAADGEDSAPSNSAPEDLDTLFKAPIDPADFRQGEPRKKPKCKEGNISCGGRCLGRNPKTGKPLVCRSELTEEQADGLAELRAKIAELEAKAQAEKEITPGFVGEIDPAEILADPKRFQYKLLGEMTKTGEVGSLSGVQTYDPNLAGVVQVWKDPGDGKLYVINGHNRLALAKRAGAEKITVRAIDAPDAKHARAIGALTNIAEGRGTGLDAAKFFRDSGLDEAAIRAKGIPLREAIAQKGLAIAKLEDGLFTKLVNGDISEERAAILGGSGLSPAKQRDLQELAEQKSKGRSKALSNEVLAELIAGVKASEATKVAQIDLFGNSTQEKTNAIERASLAANIRKQLTKDKRLFGLVARSQAAKELARGDNQINREASKSIAEEAELAGRAFDQLKNVSGPISAALNKAAIRVGAGEKQAAVQKELYAEIAAIVKEGKY